MRFQERSLWQVLQLRQVRRNRAAALWDFCERFEIDLRLARDARCARRRLDCAQRPHQQRLFDTRVTCGT